jgi:parvulin-like peptidyl-prolyl isomerase
MNAEDTPQEPGPAGGRDFAHVRYRRSVTLFAIGAVTGLLLAGFALFTAKGTSTLVVPAEDVALVNQQPIARSDYYMQLKALYSVDFAHATPRQRQTVLDQMIREELFVQRGRELDVASNDTDVRSATVGAVEGSIAADVLASRPSDDKLMAYYKAHQAAYSGQGIMTVRDLVFPPANANTADTALQNGADVNAVATQYGGRDSGRVNGEEFYFAAKIHLGEQMFAVAQSLASGTASAPLPAPDGMHILYMTTNKPPVPSSFEEAHAAVLSDYQRDAIARVEAQEEHFFRKRANVLIAKDLR